ncbi:MAG: hypothetical protein OXB86_05005 [Bdellovibrionales bacterium]|nr:hypothetical protein [Bdellovibrionales bacterium]
MLRTNPVKLEKVNFCSTSFIISTHLSFIVKQAPDEEWPGKSEGSHRQASGALLNSIQKKQ